MSPEVTWILKNDFLQYTRKWYSTKNKREASTVRLVSETRWTVWAKSAFMYVTPKNRKWNEKISFLIWRLCKNHVELAFLMENRLASSLLGLVLDKNLKFYIFYRNKDHQTWLPIFTILILGMMDILVYIWP